MIPPLNRHTAALTIAFALSVNAAAGERAFVFSVIPERPAEGRAFVFSESTVGDPGTSRLVGDGLEQKFGFQARAGKRWTVLASALVPVSAQTRGGTTARAEALFDVFSHGDAARGVVVAMGGGAQREPGGVNVLLARGVFDLTRARFRTTANVVLEKPLASGRDAVDALTSIGFGWRATDRLDAGLEMLAEDIEGLWDPQEAEGGARLMLGPSFHYRTTGRIEANLAGGPIVLLRGTKQGSDAVRALGNQSGRQSGYVVRASLTYRF